MYLQPQRFTIRSRAELHLIKKLLAEHLNKVQKRQPDNMKLQMRVINLFHKAASACGRTKRP